MSTVTTCFAELREHDDRYVSNLTPQRYQGLMEPHELVLDLDADAGGPGTFLFLRGWIYPSMPASTSRCPSSTPALRAAGRSTSGTRADAGFRRASSVGFPSGKDKTVVIDLAGMFPTHDHHLRLRTNMQIYWDEAFVGG